MMRAEFTFAHLIYKNEVCRVHFRASQLEE
jgi:hypothetical protein